MKAFPNPLTPAEEKKYIQRYTEGDLEAKHILIERNLRLVAHVIRKYQNTSEDPEDLISIGTIGLIKAIITFDPEKGNRLAAYASRCVENEVLMYLRARKKCSHEISLYEPIGTDREGNEVNLYDIIESTETDIPERIHLKDNIQKLYEKLENELSPREKLVLKMRYGLYQGEEYTQREIAAQLGISRSYVSRIEKSAIEKVMKDRKKRRLESQPLEYPSAGSVFRNPSVDMPSGKIIEELGLKGLTKGGAQVSLKHANFIINTGGASADDIKELIMYVKKSVKDNKNIDLKVEQEFVNWE